MISPRALGMRAERVLFSEDEAEAKYGRTRCEEYWRRVSYFHGAGPWKHMTGQCVTKITAEFVIFLRGGAERNIMKRDLLLMSAE